MSEALANKTATASHTEDKAWVTRTKQGDRAAFSNLVEKYQRPIYSLCYRMLGEAAAAEDAAQEVFIRAYLKLNSYDDTHLFSTWLYAIANYYCLDQLKRRKVQLVSWEDAPTWKLSADDLRALPEAAVLESEKAEELQQLLKSLPEVYRSVLILKYWHSMSGREMAQALNTSVSAIKSRLFRARQLMTQAVT